MSTTITVTEDFPSLPIQKKITKKDHTERSNSAESSVSSSSVGAFRHQKTNVVEILPRGTYTAVEDLVVRPHLRCHCKRCDSKWLSEKEWAKAKCKRAQRVAADSGFVFEVLESKIVHHKKGSKRSEFSVAHIQWEEKFECETEDDKESVMAKPLPKFKTLTFHGWCFSNCLTRKDQNLARASVSSSVGAFRCQKTNRAEVLPQGTYFAVEDLILRPYLRCRCEGCGTDWLTEREWVEGKCRRTQTISEPGFVCKVLESKVVHHKVGSKHSEFSVARIQWEEQRETETVTFQRWCLSNSLFRKHEIRSTSTASSNVDSRQEVGRSRSHSVASSYIPTSAFMLGEPVLAKTDTVEWKKATVQTVDPLKVVVEGTGEVVSHLSKVKKMTTRNFLVTRDISVRDAQLNDNWAVTTGTLKKGTTIAVCYTSGYEGFVTSPVCGWITMRSAHSVNVVKGDFVPQEQKPTLFVNHLPGDLTQAELSEKLVVDLKVDVRDIRFESNGTAYRAVLTFGSHKQASQLAERKTIPIRFGWNLRFSWDLRYLQNHALSS